MQIWNEQIWILEEEGTYRSSLYTCPCIFILYTTYKLAAPGSYFLPAFVTRILTPGHEIRPWASFGV